MRLIIISITIYFFIFNIVSSRSTVCSENGTTQESEKPLLRFRLCNFKTKSEFALVSL